MMQPCPISMSQIGYGNWSKHEHVNKYAHSCTHTNTYIYTYGLTHTCLYTLNTHKHIHISCTYIYTFMHTHTYAQWLSNPTCFRTLQILASSFLSPVTHFPAASSFKNFPSVSTLALKHGLYLEINSSWRKNSTCSSISLQRLLQIIEQLAMLFAGELDSLSPPTCSPLWTVLGWSLPAENLT